MNLFWKIAKIVGIAIVLLIVSFTIWIFYLGTDKTDTFYIANASLLNPKYLYELENRLTEEDAYTVLRKTPSVYAHRLKRGGGTVFAYRWFSEGRLQVIDDERFEKITIWLPEIPAEKVSKFDISSSTSVIVVYTEGGSAWPSDACSGYLDSGELVIQRKGKRFVVSLQGTLNPMGARPLGDWCTSKIIAREFGATEIEHHELTTWLGKPGAHPYSETYR